MFRPNRTCTLYEKGARDIFGQASFGAGRSVPCAVVHLQPRVEDTSVRADSSATRGTAEELQISATLLFPATVKPKLDDVISIADQLLEVAMVEPRYHVFGHLDHYEVRCAAKEGEL